MGIDKKSLLARVIEGYERAKKPLAYSVMTLAVVLGAFPPNVLPEGARTVTYTAVLLILSLILLEVLFEIYERVVTEEKQLNLIDSNDLYSEILGIVSDKRTVNIKFLAVAGRVGWVNVLSKLLDRNHPESLPARRISFKVEVALLDPEYCRDNAIFEEFDVVERTVKNIKRLQKQFEAQSSDSDESFEITLAYYRHMPNLLGFLVDDNYLFLTHSNWEFYEKQPILKAGGSDYFVYNRSDDFGGSELIRRFSGWFQFIVSNAASSTHSEPAATEQRLTRK
ncbi:MAG: hypothetical protein AAGA92_12520 [Planctomycetota bacterium]